MRTHRSSLKFRLRRYRRNFSVALLCASFALTLFTVHFWRRIPLFEGIVADEAEIGLQLGLLILEKSFYSCILKESTVARCLLNEQRKAVLQMGAFAESYKLLETTTKVGASLCIVCVLVLSVRKKLSFEKLGMDQMYEDANFQAVQYFILERL